MISPAGIAAEVRSDGRDEVGRSAASATVGAASIKHMGRVLAGSYYHGYLVDVSTGDNTIARRLSGAALDVLKKHPDLKGCRYVDKRLYVLLPYNADTEWASPPAWMGITGARAPPVVVNRAGTVGLVLGDHTMYTVSGLVLALEFPAPLRTVALMMRANGQEAHIVMAARAFVDELKRLLVAHGGICGVTLVTGTTQQDVLERTYTRVAEKMRKALSAR